MRYTQLDSNTDQLVSNSSSLGFGSRRTRTTGLNFANSNYKILENIKSGVAEWNSILGSNKANSLIVGYTYQDESRESVGEFFPMVDILNAGTVYTTFGFEPFTPNNELRYKTFQIQDNFTWNRGNHAFTFGATAQRYKSENVFFPGSQSVYIYNSLADFYTDANDYLANPNRDDLAGDPPPVPGALEQHPRAGEADPAARRSGTRALYAQDEWQATDRRQGHLRPPHGRARSSTTRATRTRTPTPSRSATRTATRSSTRRPSSPTPTSCGRPGWASTGT